MKELPAHIKKMQMDTATCVNESADVFSTLYATRRKVLESKTFLLRFKRKKDAIKALDEVKLIFNIIERFRPVYEEALKTKEPKEVNTICLDYILAVSIMKKEIVQAFSYNIQADEFSTKVGIERWKLITTGLPTCSLKAR